MGWLSREPRMDESSKNSTNSPNPVLQRTFCHNQRRELASFSFGQKPLRSSAPEIVIPPATWPG